MAFLADIAATGDRVATLRALRDTLARAIDDAEPKEVAPLARQLALTLAALAELAQGEADPIDEVRRARDARRAKAAGS